MSTRFFTNDNSNTLLKKFEGIFENNPDLARFDALVGYVRFKKQYISGIPIPAMGDQDKARLSELSEACTLATQKNDTAPLSSLDSEVNRIVYRLFELKASEIA